MQSARYSSLRTWMASSGNDERAKWRQLRVVTVDPSFKFFSARAAVEFRAGQGCLTKRDNEQQMLQRATGDYVRAVRTNVTD